MMKALNRLALCPIMRTTLITFGHKLSQPLYRRAYKKRPAWPVDLNPPQAYPANSLGHALADFLNKNDYKLMAQFEDHDVIHVLTQIPNTLLGELDMQYYLLGNGKRSPYLWLVVVTGLLLYPLRWRQFWRRRKQGQQAYPLFREDYRRLLHCSLDDLRRCFNIQLTP